MDEQFVGRHIVPPLFLPKEFSTIQGQFDPILQRRIRTGRRGIPAATVSYLYEGIIDPSSKRLYSRGACLAAL
jgi:hypothetical protein